MIAVTTATNVTDAHLPQDWNDLAEVHLTCLGRFSVYLIRVAVVRSGERRLVFGRRPTRAPSNGVPSRVC